MIPATFKIEFDAAHRVLGHPGKCANLHGHRYVTHITVAADKLDDLGCVVDFGDVKGIAKAWIDHHWDHNIILNEKDPLAFCYENKRRIRDEHETTLHEIFGPKPPFIMPGGANPTAENMVELLFHEMQQLLFRQLKVTVEHVRLYETPNCWTDYS